MENHNLNVICFNCKSLYSRLSELKIYIYSKKPHVVCLSETWLFGDVTPNFINYRSFWKNRSEGRGGGVGILIRNDIFVLPSDDLIHINSSLEVQRVTIKTNSCPLDIMNIYNASPRTNVHQFSNYFKQLSNNFIVLGDFNAHSPLWSIAGTPVNEAGKSLLTFLENSSNFSLASKKGLATYLHTNGRQSVLDLCFCSANLTSRIDTSTGPCLGSDHLPLLINIKTSIKHQYFKTRKKLLTKTWTGMLGELACQVSIQIIYRT